MSAQGRTIGSVFRSLPPPIATFEGYRVLAFRQGRCNLAFRRLHSVSVRFAPQFGRLGIFLPQSAAMPDEAWLREAWIQQGQPSVHLPTPNEVLLFGRSIPIREIPFAGYDDVWQADETLCCAFRRQVDAQHAHRAITAFTMAQLQLRAQELLSAWQPRLPRLPTRVIVKPLANRTLGQCTRDGEIRLNPKLIVWPEDVLAETLAHEVTHLTHFNHSPAFWRQLTELLPDWLPRSLAHYLSSRQEVTDI